MSLRNRPRPGGLFVSYDGLLEPLGQSQILPYVMSLADAGMNMHIISFEKWLDSADFDRRKTLEDKLRERGVSWTCLTYHRRPRIVSTLFDTLLGIWVCAREAHRRSIRIVHSRSYVPALMALPAKWLTGAAFIFDIRGFWPEERVQLGIFRPGGFLFHLCKRLEKVLWRNTDRLITLTARAKHELAARPEWHARAEYISVIPCCVDLDRFAQSCGTSELKERYGLRGKHIVGNIGAVSNMYLLPTMFQFFSELDACLPNLHFLYLTRQDPAPLYRLAREAGVAAEDLTVVAATPGEIPEWLSVFELGVFFPTPSYASLAMAPTKLGEFLAAGVPVVTSAGVGDVTDVVDSGNVGVLLREFSKPELAAAAKEAAKLIPVTDDVRDACRRAAVRHFDLETGCRQYVALYNELLGTHPSTLHAVQRRSA